MKSWRTTTTGVAGILIAALTALVALVDGDATTNPDWSAVGTAIVLGIGLIKARDNKASESK